MKCLECNAALDDDSIFCDQCGEPVTAESGEAPPPPPAAAKKPPAEPTYASSTSSARGTYPEIAISHWYKMFEGLRKSPLEFYAEVGAAVRERQIPGINLSRVDYREGTFFSTTREYLRVRRGEFIFDICGVPFGNGFFVSWWLGAEPSGCLMLLSEIPVVGGFFVNLLRPNTYYRLDTAYMFQELVRSALNEAIGQMTDSKGMRGLTEAEAKPILRSFEGG